MELFGTVQLKLAKQVKKGDKETLLSLFDADARFEPIEVLVATEEDAVLKVVLEGLGEANLVLGADVPVGRKKTIMTLFWFVERSKLIEMKRDADVGEKIVMNIW
jgi:hypothetical protein